MIYVVCQYGDGDKPMSPVSGSLIISQAEAIERGFRELRDTWPIPKEHRFAVHFKDGDSVLREGIWINVNCPEIGLTLDNLYVDGVRIRSDGPAVLIDLTCIKYYFPNYYNIQSIPVLEYESEEDDLLELE